MNILNITAELEHAYTKVYGKENPGRIDKDVAAISQVPMLTYDFGNEEDDQMRKRIANSFLDTVAVTQTPFDSFRYWLRFPHSVYYGICSRYGDRELVSFGYGTSRQTGQKVLIRANIEPPANPGDITFKARIWHIKGAEFDEVDVEKLSEARLKTVNWLIGTLSMGLEQMSMEYLRPDQHVATVVPDKQGKSVQWVKARTHYTIVHRKHAANTKGVTKGSVVKVDEAKELTRLAHTRRAHYRVLRSERFKKKRNERIFIKSMWVGPEEWRDGGGQVYRIADNFRK